MCELAHPPGYPIVGIRINAFVPFVPTILPRGGWNISNKTLIERWTSKTACTNGWPQASLSVTGQLQLALAEHFSRQTGEYKPDNRKHTHTHPDTKHKTNRSYCWLANKCARCVPFCVHFLESNLFSCWFISQSQGEGNIPSGNGVITWGNVQTFLAPGQWAGRVASVRSVQTLLYWYKRWTINAWKRV